MKKKLTLLLLIIAALFQNIQSKNSFINQKLYATLFTTIPTFIVYKYFANRDLNDQRQEAEVILDRIKRLNGFKAVVSHNSP